MSEKREGINLPNIAYPGEGGSREDTGEFGFEIESNAQITAFDSNQPYLVNVFKRKACQRDTIIQCNHVSVRAPPFSP